MSYSFTDERPYLGVSYYRLRQTDFNGNTETFAPRPIKLEDSKEHFSMTLKEQVKGVQHFTVNAPNDGNVLIELFDITGKVVLSKEKKVNMGENKLRIFQGKSPDAIYILRVSMGTESVSTKFASVGKRQD